MKVVKQIGYRLSMLALLSPCFVLAQEKSEADNTRALERIEKKN